MIYYIMPEGEGGSQKTVFNAWNNITGISVAWPMVLLIIYFVAS